MLKILLVFGTRPEAIKMAPLVHVLQKQEQIEAKVCVTAQHREMLDSVLDLFDITPDYDLNVMKSGQSLTVLTSRMLTGLEGVLQQFEPEVVLVHGDTSTTLSASLSAFYQKIDIGHIEAGLRTYNIYSPWPEESNRQLTSVLSRWHFSPTNTAAGFLKIDITPFPRKPQPVSEMVSPMKPLEAAAMKKAILVSSVNALEEMIIDGQTGLVFEKGNVNDLADKLEIFLDNKKLRIKLGENSRKWVESERTWDLTTKKLVDRLELPSSV